MVTALLLFLAAANAGGRKNGANITWKNALTVGAAQVVATMPGISRSGSTISAGLLCGFSREYAVSYSFILGIPAVLGAIVLEIGDAAAETTPPMGILVVGFVTALIFGILSIKLVRWLVKDNKFRLFAYYTLILGILVIGVGFIDRFTGHAIQGFFMGLAGHVK